MKLAKFPKNKMGEERSFLRVLAKLSTASKVQDFLNCMPFNFEKNGETCKSPAQSIATGSVHCMEGAMLAAAAFWYHGGRPLVLDLRSTKNDQDHVVALFQKNGLWGAVSKTNHSVLRYRDPIYKTMRELAISYFHEYFLDSGEKTMRDYSNPFDLSRFGVRWLVGADNLFEIPAALDDSPHVLLFPKYTVRALRLAEDIEIQAGKIVEYDAHNRRLFR